MPRSEPVDDPRARRVVTGGERHAHRLQRVDQRRRCPRVPAPACTTRPAGLRDHGQMLVVVADRDRRGRRCRLRRCAAATTRRGRPAGPGGTWRRAAPSTVHRPGLESLLDAPARLVEPLREHDVERARRPPAVARRPGPARLTLQRPGVLVSGRTDSAASRAASASRSSRSMIVISSAMAHRADDDADVGDVEDRPPAQVEEVDDRARREPGGAEQPVGDVAQRAAAHQPVGDRQRDPVGLGQRPRDQEQHDDHVTTTNRPGSPGCRRRRRCCG